MHVGELSASGWRFEASHSMIFSSSLAYSSSGRLAYITREAEEQFVVLDGEMQGTGWEGISDELGWSPNGERYSFVGKRGEQMFVAAPDNLWQIEGAPLPRRFAQNGDGSQIAWLTQAKHQELFINGQRFWQAPEFVENPVWSPDAKRMAFAFAGPQGVTISVDGREFGPYPSLNKGTPVWSPNSQRCGWAIQRRGKSVVVIDGEEHVLPFSVVQGGTLVFSPDGSRWALTARTGLLNLKGCIVVDGQSGPVYLGLGTTPPVWNPAGDALAYFVARGLKHTFIVCDGREGQRCTAFIDGSLSWSPDGEIVGCIAQQDGKPCIALEGRNGRSWSLSPEVGFLMRGDKVVFEADHTIRDLGFRTDGAVFGWTADL
jgi:Tol biopolymer transport system component